ncbi:ABC transporter permease [Aquamicrobium terrae]|uniref:Peptide/nickel transport system permease protein n=1 Tax=Aquamicrobium terrae TaxID=1324945 RepID=A0ABV2N6T3_9HYPH
MIDYIVRRTLLNIMLLVMLTTLMFILFRLVPADPVAVILSPDVPEDVRNALRRDWGLDRPLAEQFLAYIWNLLRGDFGISFAYQQPVWTVLSDKLLNTVVLMIPATLVAVIIGIAGGVLFAWKRGTWLELIGVILPPVLRGIPVFWLGVILLMIFAYGLKWFPIGGMSAVGVMPASKWDIYLSVEFLRHLALPALCMILTSISEPILIMRSSMLETSGEDYLELIRAKGASEGRILYHAARGSMLPVVTWVFHMFGYAISSTVVIEIVFSWPGLGREMVNAISAYDYPLVQASFFLISVIVISLNFLTDIVYGFLDPRVTYS